jgi:hypothetical protein
MEKERHHYVPKFYLKNFTFDKDRKFLYVYERKGEVKKVSITDVAVKKGFYTFVDESTKCKIDKLEEFFADIENKTAPVLNKIISSENLNISDSDREILSLFISTLYIRTLRFFSIQKDILREMIKNILNVSAQDKENFSNSVKMVAGTKIEDDEIELAIKLVLEGIDKNFRISINDEAVKPHFFKIDLETAWDLAKIFLNIKKWHLLINNTDLPFITSDNPVVIQKPNFIYDDRINRGLGFATIILPISPKLCLLLRNKPFKKEIIDIDNVDHIKKINYSVMLLSYRFIFSNINSEEIKQSFDSILPESRKAVEWYSFGPFIRIKINPVIDDEIDFDLL